MTIRRLLWLATVLGALAAGGWNACGFRRGPRVEVATASVSVGSIVRRIIATGTLQAVRTVQVGTQVSGTIQFLAADFNAIVHKGQVLAKLDSALFAAEVDQAEATLGEAKAAMFGFELAAEDARTKLKRAEQLATRQLIPQADLDAARIVMDQANADLAAGSSQVLKAQAAVAEAKANLDHTIISSPIDGIVVSRNVDVGQTVAAAVQAPVLFNIATDLRKMQVEVDIDEADIDGVQPGARATFEVESYPDETFEGTISAVRLQPVPDQTTTATAVGTAVGGQTTTIVTTVVSYATMINVANADERLRPGMTATVTLSGSHRERAVRIPNAALSFRPPPDVLDALGQTSDVPAMLEAEALDHSTSRRVWQYDGRQFMPVAVRTGVTDDRWTELLAGPLRPGTVVVTSASIANDSAH